MKCIYLRIRSRKYQKYFFCKFNNKEISLSNCKNCYNFNFKINKPIKKKSNRLKKLENQRDKNIIKKGRCEYCNKEFKHLDSHEVYGGSNRKRSILNGFVKRICSECHSNEKVIAQLRIDTQKEYEKTHTREEFIKLIGKSYLDD